MKIEGLNEIESIGVGIVCLFAICIAALLVCEFYTMFHDTYIEPPEQRFHSICKKHSIDSESYNKCMVELYAAEESSNDL